MMIRYERPEVNVFGPQNARMLGLICRAGTGFPRPETRLTSSINKAPNRHKCRRPVIALIPRHGHRHARLAVGGTREPWCRNSDIQAEGLQDILADHASSTEGLMDLSREARPAREDLAQRTVRRDPAILQHDHPVDAGGNQIDIVCRQHHRRPGAGQPSQQRPELIGDRCIICILSEDRKWLTPVAMDHANPAMRALMHEALTSPHPLGERHREKIMASSQSLLLLDWPTNAASASDNRMRP